MKVFENIKVDDQLELTASRGGMIYSDGDLDPNKIVNVAVVTHIWFDPVDNCDYVGISYLKANGTFGKPKEKRTITGLARCGWRYASKDWIKHLQAIDEADKEKVVRFRFR